MTSATALAAGPDVPHGGGGAVPGLGHDQLEGNARLAEMGSCGVTELVQFPTGAGRTAPGRGRSRAALVPRSTSTPEPALRNKRIPAL